MGLFSSKKKTQSELVTERMQAMKADENQTLADFYRSEMGQEEEIRKKIQNPPSGVWKKNRYKNKKRAELQELSSRHASLFDLEGMANAEALSAGVQHELDEKKGEKEQADVTDIEEVFETQELYDGEQLIQEELLLRPTERYKGCKAGLASCKRGEKPVLDEKTGELVQASLMTILGAAADPEQAMHFLEQKHPRLRNLLCYRALLESMEQELGIMLRQEHANLQGLKKSEYAKLYAQRLAADALVARAVLQQQSMQQEFLQYIREVEQEEEEARQRREQEERVRREQEERENEERRKREEQEAKRKAPYQALYDKLKIQELAEEVFVPQGGPAAKMLDLYRKILYFAEDRIRNHADDMEERWNEIRKTMAGYGLFRNMGAVTDITAFSLTLIEKPTFGADFLKQADEPLLLEYAAQAAADAFAQAVAGTSAAHPEYISKKEAEDVKKKAERIRQNLRSDEVNKERIEKAKADFKAVRHAGIEETWQKYPESFAYYEFMNGEVVKTNHFLKGTRKEKGLFETKDFNVFDSNKPEELEAYVKYYEENYLAKEPHDPMYDEVYEYLKKHVAYRIAAIRKLQEAREKGPDEAYKKGKTWEIDEAKGSYYLKGYETPKQNTAQGCWSVAMAAMLQFRGYPVSQVDIRSHRFEADTRVNYNSSYYQNMNMACNIADHANLLAELAPDTMMKQVSFLVMPSKAELKEKIKDYAKEAIGKSHGPLVLLFRGHYRILYGCEGENVTVHNPLEEAAKNLSLDALVEQMKGSKDLSFYWLADLPELNAEGQRVVETENKDIAIHYDKDGVIEYQGLDEYEDPGLSIVRSGYAQFCTGGTMMTHLDYVFLPGSKKHKIEEKK